LLQLEPVGWVVWVNRNLNRKKPGGTPNPAYHPTRPINKTLGFGETIVKSINV